MTLTKMLGKFALFKPFYYVYAKRQFAVKFSVGQNQSFVFQYQYYDSYDVVEKIMVNVANAIEESGNIFYCKFERVIEYTQKTLLVCKKNRHVYTPARPPPPFIFARAMVL